MNILDRIIQQRKQSMIGDIDCPNRGCVWMDQMHGNTVQLITMQDSTLQHCVFDTTTPLIDLIQHGQELTPYDASRIHCFKRINQTFIVPSDAMITNVDGLVLAVKTADCLPILILALPYRAVIHAGREGTLKQITYSVAQSLHQLGCEDPQVWFGPHSCVCCYEIHSETKTHFDLFEHNLDQIKQVFGSSFEYETSPFCTQCHSNLYYSYRSGDHVKRNYFYLK